MTPHGGLEHSNEQGREAVGECVGWGARLTTAKGEGFIPERFVITATALNPPVPSTRCQQFFNNQSCTLVSQKRTNRMCR